MVIPRQSLVNEQPYYPSPYDRPQRATHVPLYPTPLINPHDIFSHIESALSTAITDQYKIDLEIVAQRQKLLEQLVKTACPNNEGCKKINAEAKEDDDRSKHWTELKRSENFFSSLISAKTAIEKLTLRQNMMYEYVACSCSATECNASVKPVLDLMFSNNSNISRYIVKNLSSPSRAASNDIVDSLFGQIPYFSQWLSSFNFNPLSSLFGIPFGFYPYTVLTSPPIYEPNSFWEYVKPIYTSSPIHTSTTGSVSTSATTTSSGQPSSKPGGDTYVVSTPEGGLTQVSSSTDESGSSIAVASTSGPSARVTRQVIYGGPYQASPGFANQAALGSFRGPPQAAPGYANQAALASLSGTGFRPGVPGGPFFGGVPYRSVSTLK